MKVRRVLLGAGVLVMLVGISVAGATFAASATSSAKAPVANPYVGMTDEQRRAHDDLGRLEFQSHYETWIESLDLSKIDFAKLPRGEMAATWVDNGIRSVAEARSRADAVVRSHVVRIIPGPKYGSGTDVVVHVDTSIKGPAEGADIVVHQASFLEPTPDWQGVVVVDLDADPLLLPGDQAVLFLAKGPTARYSTLTAVGQFRIVNGKINPLRVAKLSDSPAGSVDANFVNSLR